MNEEYYISEDKISEWEEENKELKLYVCSECGLVCNEMIDHDCCGFSQDWWHIKVKCIKNNENNKEKYEITYTDGFKQELIENSSLKAFIVANNNKKFHGGDFKVEKLNNLNNK